MKILLDPHESEEYLVYLESKKHSTSMRDVFPTVKEMCDDKLPKGCKLPPATKWPSHHKEEIMAMVADGKFPREIAHELGMNVSSVKHLVYTEKKARRKLAEAKEFLAEARQSPVADETKPPMVIAEERAEDVSEAITDALRTLVGARYSVVYIRDKLNREFGRNYTKDDIVTMRSEL